LRPRAALTALVIVALFAGCGRFSLLRSGAPAGPYFSTRLCGVDLDGKTKDVHLRIELAVAKTLPARALVEVEFENPAERSAPLFTSRTVAGDERTLLFVSPAVTGVRARGYEVVARVYASPEKKHVLGQHTQVCESLIDQRELGPQFR
jgi:hypothetical protein